MKISRLLIFFIFLLFSFALKSQRWKIYNSSFNSFFQTGDVRNLYYDTFHKLQIVRSNLNTHFFDGNSFSYKGFFASDGKKVIRKNGYYYYIVFPYSAGGLEKWDSDFKSGTNIRLNWLANPTSDDLNDILLANNGDIWIAATNALVKYDGNFTFTNFTTPLSGPTANYITLLSNGDSNCIWMAVKNNGLVKKCNNTWATYDTSNNKLKSMNVSCMAFDKMNNLWVGYYGNKYYPPAYGISKFNGSSWTHFNADSIFGNGNTANTIYIDDSAVWFGSSSSVVKYKNGKFKSYNKLVTPNVPSSINDVYTITRGLNNRMWFGGNSYGLTSLKEGPFTFGNVYNDLNKNCILDSNEKGFSYKKIILNPGNRAIKTDTFGYWEIDSLSIGSYTISFDSISDIFYRNTCSLSYSFNVTQADSETRAPNIGLYTEALHGKVVRDVAYPCILSYVDIPLEKYKVIINPGNRIVYTDTNGNWSVPFIPYNTYTISLDTSHHLWKNSCDPDTIITNGQPDMDVGTFFVEPKYNCAYPNISIHTRGFRVCDTIPIVIQIENDATSTSSIPSSTVIAFIDTNLTVLSASHNFTNLGNGSFQFSIPTINQGNKIKIVFQARVKCSLVIGTTLCLNAKLNPTQACYLDSTPNYTLNKCSAPYDNSNYKIVSACDTDSVKFTITNIGTGNGICFAPMFIFLNGIIYIKDSIKLNAGQYRIIKLPRSGHTWSLLVSQHPLMPGKSNPISSVERCGDLNNWQSGIPSQFPQDNDSRYLYNYCNQIRNSYDPNDKIVLPTGHGSNHFIRPNIKMEYTINFQNTGNDVARLVVLKDTISPFLNNKSFRNLISSHEYTHHWESSGVSVWTFRNINLPDSHTNLKASQGFIKYEINQMTNLANMTVVDNKAYIYFDYNPPIITNNVSNTILDNSTLKFDTILYVTEYDSFIFHGNIYYKSGIYLHKLKTVTSIDSNVILNLIIDRRIVAIENTITNCDSLMFKNKTYFQNNTFYDTIKSIYTDTIIKTKLIVNKSSIQVTNHTAYNSHLWQGNIYAKSGTYQRNYRNKLGCDSILVLNLIVKQFINSNLTYKVCDSTIYKSKVYTKSTFIFDTFKGSLIDTFFKVTILVNNSSKKTLSYSSCKFFKFKDSTYTKSGIYTYNLKENGKCDTTVILSLNILKLNNDILITNDTLYSKTENVLYQWYRCQPIKLILGAQYKYYIPTSDGEYMVRVNNNECIDTSSCIQFLKNSLINFGNQNIEIYPNPSNSKIYFKNTPVNSIVNIKNILGELVKVYTLDSIELEISNLNLGLYFIEIQDKNGNKIHLSKLLKN